jgi:hypothetical protein
VRALPIPISSPLGLLLGDIAIPLGARRALVSVAHLSTSRVAPLRATLLATTHRRRDRQSQEHNRNGDDDHDDTSPDRKHGDKAKLKRSLLELPASGYLWPARRAAADVAATWGLSLPARMLADDSARCRRTTTRSTTDDDDQAILNHALVEKPAAPPDPAGTARSQT